MRVSPSQLIADQQRPPRHDEPDSMRPSKFTSSSAERIDVGGSGWKAVIRSPRFQGPGSPRTDLDRFLVSGEAGLASEAAHGPPCGGQDDFKRRLGQSVSPEPVVGDREQPG